MSSGDAESWARLRLVQGESTAQVWELISSAGHTTLTVGSNPTCNWVVRERGVAPVHFSLHWDGATLRVADTYGAGDVRVDGVVLGPQWKPLGGRVRIDFGKAAMVAEASGSGRSDSAHPLEPSPAEPPRSEPASGRPNMKATLIGVSPLSAAVGGLPAAQATSSSGGSGASDSFRPARSSDSSRPVKATLVGLPAAQSSSPPSGSAAPSAPANGGKGIPAGTLMGIGLAEALGLEPKADSESAMRRVGGASLADGDQRTIQGFPSQPTIQVGTRAEPGVSNSGVTSAPTRAVISGATPSAAFRGAARDTSVEVLESSAGVGQAVLVEPAGVPRSDPPAGAMPRTPSSYPPPNADRGQRFSDAPTQMRDGATVNSVRPKKPFPWAYVGIGVLTAVAYFAWLYLLDHL